jgi:hypothetical protein
MYFEKNDLRLLGVKLTQFLRFKKKLHKIYFYTWKINGSMLLTLLIPCGFWTKLGNFEHSQRNHFSQKKSL